MKQPDTDKEWTLKQWKVLLTQSFTPNNWGQPPCVGTKDKDLNVLSLLPAATPSLVDVGIYCCQHILPGGAREGETGVNMLVGLV
jgi:hypothetical protein